VGRRARRRSRGNDAPQRRGCSTPCAMAHRSGR
jgi:hypothetical protein